MMGVVWDRGAGRGLLSLLVLLSVILVGCGESAAARWRGLPATSVGSEPAASSRSSAADGTDIDACHDGDCEILVSEPVDIPVDRRFNLVEVSVTEIGSDTVSVEAASASGGYLQATVSVGGTASLNGLNITIVDVTEGGAVLRFAP